MRVRLEELLVDHALNGYLCKNICVESKFPETNSFSMLSHLDVHLDQGLRDRIGGELQLDDGEVALGPGRAVDQVEVGSREGDAFLDSLGLQDDRALLGNLTLKGANYGIVRRKVVGESVNLHWTSIVAVVKVR